eukprot:366326-Chlamydomonas_euryale.AAC.1
MASAAPATSRGSIMPNLCLVAAGQGSVNVDADLISASCQYRLLMNMLGLMSHTRASLSLDHCSSFAWQRAYTPEEGGGVGAA